MKRVIAILLIIFAEQKRHAEFEAKRAKHYYHEGTLAKNNE